jgi:uncharacterized phage protein gp47/JayE
MAFQFPTLRRLLEQTRSAFRANLKGSDAWVWPNNVYPAAKVISGSQFEAHGHIAYVSKQKHAWSSPDIESLREHGIEFNIPQNPATPARGKAIVTFVDDGAILTNARLRRSDGFEFFVEAGGTIATSGTVTVPIVAVLDGKNGNTAGGAALSIVSGITSSSSTKPTVAIDADGVSLGADLEDMESYRQRILFRKRNPPHGGAPADYVYWAGQVSGVSFEADRPTVYVERLWAGPGTVRVFPLMFDLYESGIPTPSDVARVRDYIATVHPAGASVTVSAPSPVTVDVVISGMVPNTVEVQDAVIAELKDTFRRLSRPAGTDTLFGAMPYLASPFSFSLSWIWQAVANATGEQRHKINSPSNDVALLPGQMAVLGDVTFLS